VKRLRNEESLAEDKEWEFFKENFNFTKPSYNGNQFIAIATATFSLTGH
jgi:hypothetical protein